MPFLCVSIQFEPLTQAVIVKSTSEGAMKTVWEGLHITVCTTMTALSNVDYDNRLFQNVKNISYFCHTFHSSQLIRPTTARCSDWCQNSTADDSVEQVTLWSLGRWQCRQRASASNVQGRLPLPQVDDRWPATDQWQLELLQSMFRGMALPLALQQSLQTYTQCLSWLQVPTKTTYVR